MANGMLSSRGGGGGGRIADDEGIRGGSPFDPTHSNASGASRGGFGAEQDANTLSSALPGNPHSSYGFRRALRKAQSSGSRLADQLPNKTHFGGEGFSKPNYFGQGSARHGMHIGSGAPAIRPAKFNGG